jgi:hypothetical protein
LPEIKILLSDLCFNTSVVSAEVCLDLMSNVYCCGTVSEQRAARCVVAPGGPDQRRWEAHPGIPPPAPRVEKHETPERD